MLEIAKAKPLEGYRLRLTLTTGTVIERDLSRYVKEAPGVLRKLRDRKFFDRVRAANGTVEWPGQVDLCPDALIWGAKPHVGRPLGHAVLRRGGILKRKPRTERKTAVIKIRLTEDQRRSVEQAAKKTYDDISSWARRVILQAVV